MQWPLDSAKRLQKIDVYIANLFASYFRKIFHDFHIQHRMTSVMLTLRVRKRLQKMDAITATVHSHLTCNFTDAVLHPAIKRERELLHSLSNTGFHGNKLEHRPRISECVCVCVCVSSRDQRICV